MTNFQADTIETVWLRELIARHSIRHRCSQGTSLFFKHGLKCLGVESVFIWNRGLKCLWVETSVCPLFLYICKISIIWLHSANRRGHKKSITRGYADTRRRKRNVSRLQLNGVLDILYPSQCTMQSNEFHMILNSHSIYIYTIHISCVDAVSQCNTPHSLASVML